jgi:delta1-piperideine-2-carboxylate reductase|eukprot:COSAG06_NODE_14308_length_1168_cov_1.411600_2_plen_110_part_00
MMVELLAAGLTGSQLSFEAADSHPDWHGPSNHGELLILMDPQRMGLGGGDGYLRHCEELFERVVAEDGTRLPSARRYAARRRTPSEGIVLPTALHRCGGRCVLFGGSFD